MTTLADSLIASTSRPLTVRTRPDLTYSRHLYQGTGYWVVKEPVGLQYFRFHEEEYFILKMLDGHISLQQIKEAFEEHFAPQKITYGDLQQYIGMLHRSGLVISNAPGQGVQLKQRRDQKKRRELLGKFANVFALRFRGVDPEKLLTRMIPWFGWLFSVPALLLFVVLGIAALMLIGANWTLFQAKLPTFQDFFAVKNWLFLGATMGIVKIIHEFGHGLSCKKFGGECHELGFMLLVFTPCLYCNVSDSWMLPNKWQRIWIGAGGMYFELILASIATFLWWYSEPGFFNFLCLAVMFICSVSTVIFNGNPLLRFDGYYILMDYLEIPNLRQKCTEVLKRWFQSTCLGLELQDNPFLPQKNRFVFGLYTVAAVIYRWVVVFGIIMFLNQVLTPYGLQILGRIMAIAGFAGMIFQPVWQTIKFVRTPGRLQKVKFVRVAASLAVLGAAIGFVALVPLPHQIECAFEIKPTDKVLPYYAGTPGALQYAAKAGDQVAPGDVIVELRNIELELQLNEHQGQRKVAEQNIKSLQTQKRPILSQQEVVRQHLEQENLVRERLDKLIVRAKFPGTVIPAPDKESPPADQGRLPMWSGSALKRENQGAFVMQDDLLCYVGDPNEMEAVLYADQNDIQLLRLGQRVELKLESDRGSTYEGEVTVIGNAKVTSVSKSLASQVGGPLDTEMDPKTGMFKPISSTYQASVPLQGTKGSLRPGYRGWARVHTEPKTLGWRLWRIIARTFNFEL
jgi:putative peptide zinc metalloprotease protein